MEQPILSKELNMYTLQLPSRPDSILVLENFIEELKNFLEIREDRYANILIALTEAANNAIHHGNKLDQNKKVYINLEIERMRKLVFTIADEGSGFNFEKIADPTLPENIELTGGRGIFIMKALCDQFVFNKNGNEIELHFNI